MKNVINAIDRLTARFLPNSAKRAVAEGGAGSGRHGGGAKEKPQASDKHAITYHAAMAAGRDAGDRHAKANGRSEWSHEDYNHAAGVVSKLLGNGA